MCSPRSSLCGNNKTEHTHNLAEPQLFFYPSYLSRFSKKEGGEQVAAARRRGGAEVLSQSQAAAVSQGEET